MEFGSFVEFHRREGGTFAEAFEESFEHIDMAEDLGLDGAWLSEGHFNPDRTVLSSPHSIAAAIAARTKRLKIGTAVSILPLGNPLRMAEETATIDQISQGRFEFGVGRSGLPGSYEGYGMSYAESRERFFEYLEIIMKAWTQERFSHQGKYFSYDDVCLVPKPFQSPHPTVRIAATTWETFPIIAKMGFPIFIGVRTLSLDVVADQIAEYASAWKEAGHPTPVDVSLRLPVYVADTKEEAYAEAEVSFMRQFARLSGALTASASSEGSKASEGRSERGSQLAELTWKSIIGNKVLVGTPDMVIEQVQNLKDRLQLSGVVAELNAGERIPRDKIAKSLRLYCEKVAPAFS